MSTQNIYSGLSWKESQDQLREEYIILEITEAMKSNDLNELQELTKDIQVRDPLLKRPFLLAMEADNRKILDVLLGHKRILLIDSWLLKYPLSVRNISLVKYLLDKGVKPNGLNFTDWTDDILNDPELFNRFTSTSRGKLHYILYLMSNPRHHGKIKNELKRITQEMGSKIPIQMGHHGEILLVKNPQYLHYFRFTRNIDGLFFARMVINYSESSNKDFFDAFAMALSMISSLSVEEMNDDTYRDLLRKLWLMKAENMLIYY